MAVIVGLLLICMVLGSFLFFFVMAPFLWVHHLRKFKEEQAIRQKLLEENE